MMSTMMRKWKTKQETKLIRRLLKGKAPRADFDPYAPYADWFAWDGAKYTLSNAPEPKRRFIPSKWERKKVVEYVRAICKGLIKFDKPKDEPKFCNLWGDDSTEKTGGLAYIPAPKPKLPVKKNVCVYDLLKQKLVKKLETGVREVSSIAIHPGGDNVIVGGREGKVCWFDMDLSSQPYRILKCHKKDVTNVAFHWSYPLFASCSDDGTAYIFHGVMYSDLNHNPLIVPLKILRGRANTNGRGVMDCKFHPRQRWLFTAGADSFIKLFCH